MYKAVKHCSRCTPLKIPYLKQDAPGTSYNQKVLKLFICCVYLEYLNLTVESTCQKATKCMWIQHTVHKICMHKGVHFLQIFLMQSVLKTVNCPQALHNTTFIMNGS